MKQLRADADGNGLSWATVRRAQKVLGVRARKEEMAGPWLWVLPDEGAQWRREGAHESTKVLTQNDEHLRGELSTFGDEEDGEDL